MQRSISGSPSQTYTGSTARSRRRLPSTVASVAAAVTVTTALGLSACSGVASDPAANRAASNAASTGGAGGSSGSAGTGGSASGSNSANGSGGSSAGANGAPVLSGDGQKITLAFGGDVHFTGRTAPLLKDPHSLDSLQSTLGAADFSMVNLETAIASGGTPRPKAFTFRAPASALPILVNAGIDAVSMANNHAADYGSAGLEQTLAAKDSGVIPIVGIGKNAAEAYAPLVVDVKGVKVAILASTQTVEETTRDFTAGPDKAGVASNLDMSEDAPLRQAVRNAAKDADVVLVFMHWGTEGIGCADAAQQKTLTALKADGADIVVGGHGHRPQGYGWSGSTFVTFGLGNFVFYRNTEPSSRSGVATLTLDAGMAKARGQLRRDGNLTAPANSMVTAATWTPMLIGNDGVPRVPQSQATRDRLAGVWATASKCSGANQTPPAS